MPSDSLDFSIVQEKNKIFFEVKRALKKHFIVYTVYTFSQ